MDATAFGKRWEHFTHKADIGVRGMGRTKKETFEQIALALTAISAEPENVKPLEAVEIECEAPDDEMLLVDWLNAIIYESSTRKMFFSRFDVKIKNHRLKATIYGESIDASKHHPVVEVKGATYTNLLLKHGKNREWLAECVVDV